MGDLESEYGVPLKSVTWVVGTQEAIPFSPPNDVKIEQAPVGEDIQLMVERGAIDALIMPWVPRPVRDCSPNVGTLFLDSKAEEQSYYRKKGFFPIMHIVAIGNDVLDVNPWVARAFYDVFEGAQSICYEEYASEPNLTHLAWGYQAFREQRELMGPDPWPHGIARNRANLELFINYSYNQGLIERRLDIDELFVNTLLNT